MSFMWELWQQLQINPTHQSTPNMDKPPPAEPQWHHFMFNFQLHCENFSQPSLITDQVIANISQPRRWDKFHHCSESRHFTIRHSKNDQNDYFINLTEGTRIVQNCYHRLFMQSGKHPDLVGPPWHLPPPTSSVTQRSGPTPDNRPTDTTYLHILTESRDRASPPSDPPTFHFTSADHRHLQTQTPLVRTYLQGQFITQHTQKFHVSHLKIAFEKPSTLSY